MSDPPPKIRIMQGSQPDLSAATYQIHDETHTLGNALRWMLMKNPKVQFCGYSFACSHDVVMTRLLLPLHFIAFTIPNATSLLFFSTNNGSSAPHPSENNIQIRIQMYDNLSSLSALLSALDDLDALFESIEDAYKASLEHDDIAVWDEER